MRERVAQPVLCLPPRSVYTRTCEVSLNSLETLCRRASWQLAHATGCEHGRFCGHCAGCGVCVRARAVIDTRYESCTVPPAMPHASYRLRLCRLSYEMYAGGRLCTPISKSESRDRDARAPRPRTPAGAGSAVRAFYATYSTASLSAVLSQVCTRSGSPCAWLLTFLAPRATVQSPSKLNHTHRRV